LKKLTSSTAVWAPFLDDVNVVIFLAPVSVFNQPLAEDKKMNRLVGTQLHLFVADLHKCSSVA
jgi:hypothetical protein